MNFYTCTVIHKAHPDSSKQSGHRQTSGFLGHGTRSPAEPSTTWQSDFIPGTRLGQSRWAAIDFDAHDGGAARAKTFAIAAFEVLHRRADFYLILATSGSQGWHLFVFSARVSSSRRIGCGYSSESSTRSEPKSDPEYARYFQMKLEMALDLTQLERPERGIQKQISRRNFLYVSSAASSEEKKERSRVLFYIVQAAKQKLLS